MTGIICALAGAKGLTLRDTQTVTSGSSTTSNSYSYGFLRSNFGSIADGTWNLYGGATIDSLYYSYSFDPVTGEISNNFVAFKVSATPSNSGWAYMQVGNTTFQRASATFSTVNFTTTWLWNLQFAGTTPGFNPFTSTTSVTWYS